MEALLAIAAPAAARIDFSTTSAACSALTSSSSPPAISSMRESQDLGRRTSILCQSQCLAASYQAWFTKQRTERVLRTVGSDQLLGGKEDGKDVGTSYSPFISGSRGEFGAGRPEE